MVRLPRFGRRSQVLSIYLALIVVLLTTASSIAARGRPAAPPVTAALSHPAAPVVRVQAGKFVAGLFLAPESGGTVRSDITPPKTGAGWNLQQKARQINGQPASFHWALIIGINRYSGGTRDNVGSYQDAISLRSYLVSLGWLNDHIMLITDTDAVRSNVIAGIRWLASKTDNRSVVVVHYAGHERPIYPGGRIQPMLWLSDNSVIPASDVGREMDRVRAKRMWIQMAVCRAGGFDAPGMVKPGRVLTYSSPVGELSYEDPDMHHSVFGYFMLIQGMLDGDADVNGDGFVSVEEAFVYAKPRTLMKTEELQHPVMIDKLGGDFDLRVSA